MENHNVPICLQFLAYMLFWFEIPVGIQTILVNCTSSVRKDFMQLTNICNYPICN